MQVSDNMIKMHSCTFDLEAVRVLSLAKLGIDRIDRNSAINDCSNLRYLDFSKNRLSKIGGLDGTKLVNLQALVVSGNDIASFSDLSSIPSLLHLDLRGNRISSISSLKTLGNKLPSLQSLSLQSIEGADSNPVCSTDNYKKEIMEIFPFLLALDSQRVRAQGKGEWEVYKSVEQIEKEIEQQKLANGGGKLDLSRYVGAPKDWVANFDLGGYADAVMPVSASKGFEAMLADCDKLADKAETILKAHQS